MASKERTELLAIAAQAARRAGAALQANRAAWSSVLAEQGREVKVDADTRAEALILAALQNETGFPIISEEAGWIEGAGDGRFWAVDPLDGSVNYIQGFPHCAVSIALVENGKPILGVVDCFMMGDVYTGVVEGGAWRNGEIIKPSAVRDPNRAILNTGIPARARTDRESMAGLVSNLLAWRKVRMIGSAAVALAYVADGHADAYTESGSMIWDVAGGCAIVSASGGVVTLVGEDLRGPLGIIATNGVVSSPSL